MSKDIKLVKFDTNGTILWNNTYGDWSNESIYQVIETHDGGFALFGANQYPNDTAMYFLLKVDSNNQFEWQTTYMLDDSSIGFSIQQTADHGYILGGFGYDNITGYDTYIVKTDSAGGILWATNFGGMDNDCGGIITLLANNQYLITSCYTIGFWDQYVRLTKLNNSGVIVWDSIYYNLQALTFADLPVIFLSDSSFVTVLNFRSEITGKRSNWFTHFDLQGNILSRHEYTSNPNESVYLKDIRPTPDGGFIMAGYEYTSTPQKGYLVKTDSLGRSCSWVGCDSVGYVYPVGIASPLPPPKEGELQVYPNPATNQLHITSTIPATFILYNLLGQVVRQVGLGSGTVQVSVLGLPAGTYFYQIINPQKQTLQHDKLIVLH
jgi:hypothetical protein